jgi:hypothetical protein
MEIISIELARLSYNVQGHFSEPSKDVNAGQAVIEFYLSTPNVSKLNEK